MTFRTAKHNLPKLGPIIIILREIELKSPFQIIPLIFSGKHLRVRDTVFWQSSTSKV